MTEIVGLEYMTYADRYQGLSDFGSDPRTFHRPVEKGKVIRFSTPDIKKSDYRKLLKNLEAAVRKGSDPGLPKSHRDSLGDEVRKMSPEAMPQNADRAFNMMWHLRVNVSDYPTSAPTFQKIAAFYNIHSPQLVDEQHHRPPAPHHAEPSRSPDEVVARGDLGLRDKMRIGTAAFREIAFLRMTGAEHFSPDGDESFKTQVQIRFKDMEDRKRVRGPN
ncbi:hypothetical protein [Micromonospora sp. NPDC005710]|uniref:hypothetical protein n=1 Tax=Micromonospora sp. NPDC005710 TaxID=3157051 RepID=UPI0033DAC7AF